MHIKPLITLGLFAAATAFTAAANDTLSLHEARYGAAAAEIDGRVFVCAGQGADGELGTIEAIDLANQSVSTLDLSIVPRRYLSAAAWNGKIVLVGGSPYLSGSSLELVDPATLEVETLSPLPRARRFTASVVYDDKLYVIGGSLPSRKRCGYVDIYDFETGSWSEGPDMSTRRECPVVLIGHYAYAIGGYDGSDPVTDVERLDLDTLAWETMPELPRPQSAHRALAHGERVYLFGDYTHPARVVSGNPESGDWKRIDVPYRASRHTAGAVAGNHVVVAGGNKASSRSHHDYVQIFDAAKLENAPEKARGEEPVTAREQFEQEVAGNKGLRVLVDAFDKLETITNVHIKGTVNLSYSLEGNVYTSSSPYEIAIDGSDRLYVETTDFQLWADGKTYVYKEKSSGDVWRPDPDQDYRETVQSFLLRNMSSVAEMHQPLLDPDEGQRQIYQARVNRIAYEGEASRDGHPADIITFHHTGNRALLPGHRTQVDRATGLAWSQETSPSASTEETAECRFEIEHILDTLKVSFMIEDIVINQTFDQEMFTSDVQPGEVRHLLGDHLTPHPLTLGQINSRTTRRIHAERNPPDMNLPVTLEWRMTPCANIGHGGVLNRMSSQLSQNHIVTIDSNKLVAISKQDGTVVHTVSLTGDHMLDMQRNLADAVLLPGRAPGEDRIVVAYRAVRFGSSDPQEALAIKAFAPDGYVVWEHEVEGMHNINGVMTVAPRGKHDSMLLVQSREKIDCFSTSFELIGSIAVSYSQPLEIADRDRDRLVDITVFGYHIERYEWNEN